MTESLIHISFHELCKCEKIEEHIVIDIIDYGIVKPIKGHDYSDWIFDTTSVHWIRKAVRLNEDLEIDWIAVALVIELMQEKENLLQENQRYQQQLKRFIGE